MSRPAFDALDRTWIRIANSPEAAVALERWRSDPALAAPDLDALVAALAVLPAARRPSAFGSLEPGTRVLLDAHNAYPYQGRWTDRLDRALSTGMPLAIEQDLVWHDGRSIVSHGEPFTGDEPTLEQHFFERIRPLMEAALKGQRRQQWPLITLNLDLKTDEPEHHRALWDTLGRYESWLTTAVRTGSPDDISGLHPGPLLVLTGDSAAQERAFHDDVPIGRALRLFGATDRTAPAPRRTNYRRWINYSWKAVEPEGQPLAGAWTWDDEARLERLVRSAHAAGLWIRFYTLNGLDSPADDGGWSASYNFGSLAAARERAVRAGNLLWRALPEHQPQQGRLEYMRGRLLHQHDAVLARQRAPQPAGGDDAADAAAEYQYGFTLCHDPPPQVRRVYKPVMVAAASHSRTV
ncbi:hypothetical protein [uncultured Arthrobacter sp.]|uniref:hypothetical protein n=1 Tax=uncultured Arthrobacter sp. TaxID=114050 RepID=UPI0032166FE3